MTLIEKLRSNPVQFIRTAKQDEILSLFHISQKEMNKNFKGNFEKYRKALLEGLRQGSIEIR